MTTGGPPMPTSPSGGFVPPPGQGQRPASYEAFSAPWPPPPQVRGGSGKRGALMGIGVALAVVLAAAALVVSLTRGSGAVSEPTTTDGVQQAGTNETSDRTLCEEIAPLLRESIDDGKRFVNQGQSGTPERDAAIPGYRADVVDWVGRIQPLLDKHAEPPRYLTRALQAFIDYTHLYAQNIRPGPQNEVDAAAWNNRVVAYGGPFSRCQQLGVEW